MGYKAKISPVALSDLQEGIDYYELQQLGLGERLAAAVDGTISKIKQMPLSASIAYDEVRYKLVGKFPYVILYKIDDNAILVLRIFNTHRKPEYQ